MAFIRPSKSEALGHISDLVDRYRSQRTFYESGDCPEAQLRLDLLDDFLRCFGWDVRNENGMTYRTRDVVIELSTELEGDTLGRPDYILRFNRKVHHVVEAKKASLDLLLSAPPAIQARTYGWSLSLPVAILTNFRSTLLFDSRIAPSPDDSAHVALMPGRAFGWDEYLSRFDELWELISFETVATNTYDAVFEYEEPARGSSGFDKSFLAELRSMRERLAADAVRANGGLSGDEIGRRVQRLLNALVFLRVSEDRDLDSYAGLLNSANTGSLIAKFRKADARYNAGLFSVLEDTGFSDEVLTEVIHELYWPKSKYAFGVLRPDVLATIYEQFLSEEILVDDTGIRIEPKPEIAHAGGVVTTPQFVVQELVHRPLTELLDQARDNELRILDMSCGSGVFLVEAFNQLVNHHETSSGPLDIRARGKLAVNHLFGVDIDPEAIEVAKLSLLLSILGEEWLDLDGERRVLPDLTSNLVVGNAVVSEAFHTRFPEAAKDVDRRTAVKPMSWMQAFPEVLDPRRTDRTGFDLIVGNPPYVRIQVLAQFLKDQLAYFQDERNDLQSGRAYNFDLYMVFLERALTLLAPAGRLAFIVPNRFTKSPASATLRELVAATVTDIVDFGYAQVFPGRTTYTCLLFLSADATDYVSVQGAPDLEAWKSGDRIPPLTVERSSLTMEPWIWDLDGRESTFAKVRAASKATVKEIANIFVGVQTSMDALYFINPIEYDDRLVTFTDHSGQTTQIERSITRPAIRDRTLVPFDIDPEPDAWAIFPYRVTTVEGRSKAALLNHDELVRDYPLTLEYFSRFETHLRARAVSPNPGTSYWAYGRSQSLTKMTDPKIVVRVLSREPQYAVDRSGLVVPGGGDGGPYYLMRPRPESEYSLELLVAVLSHPVIDALVAAAGKHYRGGYFVHRKAFLENLPVPEFAADQRAEVEGLVGDIHACIGELRTETDSMRRAGTQARISSLRAEVDGIVSDVLGLSAADVAQF
jgi:methylase of polypeptide subunit release factors